MGALLWGGFTPESGVPPRVLRAQHRHGRTEAEGAVPEAARPGPEIAFVTGRNEATCLRLTSGGRERQPSARAEGKWVARGISNSPLLTGLTGHRSRTLRGQRVPRPRPSPLTPIMALGYDMRILCSDRGKRERTRPVHAWVSTQEK